MATGTCAQDDRIVQNHLQPGEQVLWTGQPAPWRLARNMVWDVAVGLPATVVLAYLVWHIPTMERPVELLLLLPMVPVVLFLGPGLLLAPLFGPFMARKTLYVLTDRRALILMGSRKAHSFPPDLLQDLTCTVNHNGSGDVIFERRFRSRRPNRISFVDTGFLGIANVREVEQLVRALARTALNSVEPSRAVSPITVSPGTRLCTWIAFVIVLLFIPLSMYFMGTSHVLTLTRTQTNRVDGVLQYSWMNWVPLYDRSITNISMAELVERAATRAKHSHTYQVVLHTDHGTINMQSASNADPSIKKDTVHQINAFIGNANTRSAEVYAPAEAPIFGLLSVAMMVFLEAIIVRDLFRKRSRSTHVEAPSAS